MTGSDPDDLPSLSPSGATEVLPRIMLTDALQHGWLETWYRPKIDLRRKCLAGAEALAMVRHPELGALPFGCPVQADADDAVRLAEWMLLASFRDWATFAAAGFNLRLSFNVPLSVLVRLPIPRLADEHRPSDEHWPGLILEATEDQIVRDIAQARQLAGELQGSKIALAIDDFGTGYSSLSNLRDLPFAELKFDAGFVAGCAVDAVNAAICQTAIDLAHRLGGAAVAKDIASMADLQALMVMGCDFGQGPLIAPAMPKRDLLDLLRQRLQSGAPAAPTSPPARETAPASRQAAVP